MKIQVYRHGEINFVQTKELPDNLKEAKTNVIATGSSKNSHTFKGGKLYLKNVDTYIFGYFKAEKTKLYHPEHSPKGVSIPDGTYELRKQNEWINSELKQIID